MNRKRIKRYINKHGIDDVALAMLDHNIYKNIYKNKDDYKMPSLIDDWHVKYDDDGDCWTEYGLCELSDEYTDMEIEKYLYEELALKIFSPYDCTGTAFTMWINWHRNPNGMISIIHHKGLDV